MQVKLDISTVDNRTASGLVGNTAPWRWKTQRPSLGDTNHITVIPSDSDLQQKSLLHISPWNSKGCLSLLSYPLWSLEHLITVFSVTLAPCLLISFKACWWCPALSMASDLSNFIQVWWTWAAYLCYGCSAERAANTVPLTQGCWW